jgi:hypothetical protein
MPVHFQLEQYSDSLYFSLLIAINRIKDYKYSSASFYKNGIGAYNVLRLNDALSGKLPGLFNIKPGSKTHTDVKAKAKVLM